MAADFTIEELIRCLEPTKSGDECGLDEVLLLLADFIDDKRIHNLLNYYVDNFYKALDEDMEYVRNLEKRVEDLEDRLKYGKRKSEKRL